MCASGLLGRRNPLVVLLTLSFALPAIALGAVEVTNLGPLTYVRNTGKPTAYTTAFPGVAGPGVLHVVNSGVSSAVIRLNGTEVVPPSAFSGSLQSVTVPVALIDKNSLNIELRSKPGTSLEVRVTQAIEADGAAVIGNAGGSVGVTDPASPVFGALLSVPPGALTDRLVITVRAAVSAPPFSDGQSGLSPVQIEPSGLTFTVPATLTLPYRREAMNPDVSLGEDTLSAFTFDVGLDAWVALLAEKPDLDRRLVTTKIHHFSYFALRDARLVNAQACGSYSPYLPVLLVHGVQATGIGGLPFCGYGSSNTFGDSTKNESLAGLLVGNQVNVFEMNYNSELPIKDNAPILDRAIRAVLDCAGGNPGAVTLITHSMGGLIAREAISSKTLGTRHLVNSLVMLDTPNRGIGHLSITPSSACRALDDMVPCSSFLEGSADVVGLNVVARESKGVPDLHSCSVDYWLFAATGDRLPMTFVSTDSALGNGTECPARGPVFEPPGINDVGARQKIEVPSGCGPQGDRLCEHWSYTCRLTDLWCAFAGERWGIADVRSESHVLWPTLRDVAKTPLWRAVESPICSPINNSSLTHWYQFNGDAKDSIGHADGVNTDVVYSVANGLSGEGAGFNGATSFIQYSVDLLNDERTKPFTIAFWTRSTQTGNLAFVSKLDSEANFRGKVLYGNLRHSGNLSLQLISNNNSPNSRNTLKVNTGPVGWNDGNWHMIAVTYDGSSTASGVRIYLDGVSEDLTTETDGLSDSVVNTMPTYLGWFGPAAGTPSWLNGSLDNLAIFDQALGPAEVAELYSSFTKQ